MPASIDYGLVGAALPATPSPQPKPDAISGADPGVNLKVRERLLATAANRRAAAQDVNHGLAPTPPVPIRPGEQANAELVSYFTQLGLDPTVAAGMAARITKVAPPPEPISNGIKVHPNDAVPNLLTTKYGLTPAQATQVMQQVYLSRSSSHAMTPDTAKQHEQSEFDRKRLASEYEGY